MAKEIHFIRVAKDNWNVSLYENSPIPKSVQHIDDDNIAYLKVGTLVAQGWYACKVGTNILVSTDPQVER